MSTPRRRPFRSSSIGRSGARNTESAADEKKGRGRPSAAENRRRRRQIVVTLGFLESSYHPRYCIVTGLSDAREGQQWSGEAAVLRRRPVNVKQSRNEEHRSDIPDAVDLWFSPQGWRVMKMYQWLMIIATTGLGILFSVLYALARTQTGIWMTWILVPAFAIFGCLALVAWLYRRSHQLPVVTPDPRPQRIRILFPERLQSLYDTWYEAYREFLRGRMAGKIPRNGRDGNTGPDGLIGTGDEDFDDAEEDASTSWDQGPRAE